MPAGRQCCGLGDRHREQDASGLQLLRPDLNNDGHDTGVAFADHWLAQTFGPWLEDPRFMDGMLFVVTFDEGSSSGPNHIYTVLYGHAVVPGSVSASRYDHYSLLRTIEDAWALGTLGQQDAEASAIMEVWRRTHTLTVTSVNPSAVAVAVNPMDLDGWGDGTTPFNRIYDHNALVSLTASATAGGNTFQKWQRDGVDFATSPSVQVTVDANHALTAVYAFVPTIRAAVLPLSRSVQVGGGPATAFAAIVNTGSTTATNCAPAGPSSPPVGLGVLTYQTTTPANALSGTPNTPVNIAAGAIQNYVFGFLPTDVIPETSLAIQFLCDNAGPAPQVPGVNNFFVVASTSPVPDTVALMATLSADGVVRIPGSASTQLFAIGTSNVGATGTIVVSGDTGGVTLPLTLTVCKTGPSGACLAPPTRTVTVNYLAGTNRSFAFFAQASGPIAFDPANNRVFARLRQSGVLRGATSAAVCTSPNAGC
jgi:hypothetical protein